MAFFLIFVMMVLIGTISFTGMERLSRVNHMASASYNVLMLMNSIEESINKVELEIWDHFSGNGWKSYVETSHGANAKFNMDDQQLNASMYSIGTLPWSVQVMQGSFTLNQKKHYKLIFDAKSTTTRPIQVLFENSIYYNKYQVATVNLMNDMKQYTIRFQMQNPTDQLVHIVFGFGQLPEMQLNDRHRIIIDNVTLIEEETGKELLNNGEFASKNVQLILEQTQNDFKQSIRSIQDSISDRPPQKELVNQLNKTLDQWLQENNQMIKELNMAMASSGNLNADQELQSFASITEATKSEITQLINQINEMEKQYLYNKKQEVVSIKRLVYGSLVIVVGISIILSLFIYLYFNRTIIRPIRWTSDWLKQMAEDDDSNMTRRDDLKESKVHLAISEIRQLYYHMIDYHKLLSDQVQIDGLTGLMNRRAFDQVIADWFDKKLPFSLILIDIDHFKNINDTYGHLIGDEVLKQLAQHLCAITNDRTLSFRYGGEEFGLLIREQDVGEAYVIAECLRHKVAEVQGPTGVSITISIGIAQYQTADDSSIPIIERTDTALYQSKLNGRNRTTVFDFDKD
ncbi:diguanylate cyclase [Pontibacillus yanchengensis]|uniref:diguanylate cyclase n=1 Tax=Pontibacillus yanchengensis TaxID=462910 RepID=UPI0013717F98|nr:diguanylate cyclase [Pontibacillus yanchengensis]